MILRSAPSERRRAAAPRVACVALAVAACLAFVPSARAARWNWSGSGVLDWLRVSGATGDDPLSKRGVNVEWSLKATVELSDKATATARLCTSCHGLMVDQASAEIRLHPRINLEAGRIVVPFGDFYLRHDPSSDAFLSKPLPYSMGHMLRYQQNRFNLGVIPMPYVDNGATVFGDVWIRESIQIWYGLYGVNGFRSEIPRDFNFMDQWSTSGFNDNNDDLSWGGRLALARGVASAGGSYLRGAYDPESRFDYEAWGVDAALQLKTLRLRTEYLERATDVSDAGGTRRLRKKGFLLQLEAPLRPEIALVGRFDGLLRKGPPLSTDNDASSGIVRWTLGANFTPTPDYGLRIQYEHWRFTDFSDEDAVHAGVVVSY